MSPAKILLAISALAVHLATATMALANDVVILKPRKICISRAVCFVIIMMTYSSYATTAWSGSPACCPDGFTFA